MRGGVWKNKYRMNLFAFYGHGSVAGGKDDIPLLASVYHPCVDTNSDNEDEVTNTTMCGTQTPTSAELPGLFRADNDESRVFLSMLAGDGRQAFRGIFALPAAEDATNAVYLYSAVPVMHARENRTVGYVVGGADVRLYVRDWSKGLEACVSVWGDETATGPAAVASEAARGMVRLDGSEATQANTEGNFTQATTRLRRLFASDRRVCSSSARLEFHRRGTQACTATYTFLPNAMPTTPDDRVDAATKAVHDELARRLREHGAYLRVDVPRSARQTAVDISRTYLAMTTVVMVTMCVVLFVFVEVGVLRPLYAIVHTLKQRVNAFVEELTDGNALGRRRRKLLVHEMLADVAVARGRGDEVAIVRALAEHLNAIHGAELQHLRAGREDAELAQRLPGLARDRLKRTTLRQMAASGALVVKHPAEFKTLKHILAHPTATQFFKSYCRRCGPEAFQSLMFLIDVLWLRHIEAGSRSRLEDLASIAAHEGGGNGGNGGADDDDDDGNGNSLVNVRDGGKARSWAAAVAHSRPRSHRCRRARTRRGTAASSTTRTACSRQRRPRTRTRAARRASRTTAPTAASRPTPRPSSRAWPSPSRSTTWPPPPAPRSRSCSVLRTVVLARVLLLLLGQTLHSSHPLLPLMQQQQRQQQRRQRHMQHRETS